MLKSNKEFEAYEVIQEHQFQRKEQEYIQLEKDFEELQDAHEMLKVANQEKEKNKNLSQQQAFKELEAQAEKIEKRKIEDQQFKWTT